MTAPKQGRSGGGLFTTDGYVAGVCNFAEPRGDHGLYATPRSIYSLLDRNNLMALYAPVPARGGSGDLARQPRSFAGPGRFADHHRPRTVARRPRAGASRRASGRCDRSGTRDWYCKGSSCRWQPGRLASGDGDGQGTTRRMAWHPTHTTPAPTRQTVGSRARRKDRTDRSEHRSRGRPRSLRAASSPISRPKENKVNAEDIPPAAGPAAEPAPKSRWRPVRTDAGSAFSRVRRH